ncbi:MAG: domain S-box [bacterium]|nr:domain S-box [bacterium]
MNLDDQQRLDELRRYELFDDGPDAALRELAELAANVCEAPIGYISFIDDRYQRLLARWGVPKGVTDQIPADESICARTVEQTPVVLIIENLTTDERFGQLPLVTGLGLVFYAGASLVTPRGYALGSVCAIDYRTRTLTPLQARSLGLVRDQVMELLEARRELCELRRSESLRQEAVEALLASQHDLERRIELRTREIDEAHKKTRQLLERIGDAFVALDRDWRYIYVNERAAQLFQRTPADLIGKHIWTEFPEGVGQPFQVAYERAMRDREIVTIEALYEPWGRWFENRIYPSAQGVSVFFTEITQRRKAEEELARSRARLLEAQRVAHVGSWEWDVASDRVLWSDELYRIYGLPVGSSLGGYQAFLDRVHPDSLADAKRVVADAIEHGSAFIYDHQIVRPDGTVRMLHTRGEAMREGGKVVRLVGCCWDVTELRETSSALQRTVGLLEATLEVIGDGLLLVDADGAVSGYNQALATLFGLPAPRTAPTSLPQIAERLRDPEPLLTRARSLAPDESVERLALRDGRVLEARSRPHVVAGQVSGRVWSFRPAPAA